MQAQDKPEYAIPGPEDVVLDTNVVLDWQVFGDPAAAPLVAALEAGRLRWVATAAMLAELADVLTRPLSDRFEAKRKHSLTLDFAGLCTVLPDPSVAATGRLTCSDPADQKFIDLALARPCRWLFSHDKALLRLARRARERGVIVMPPRAWPGL
ncbi:putative nucleic acid-binding protein [Burkholderiales bacterium JOSHI_001]|nr:putative nucleic acid-binding protein [Burkholderiales bacterium JOSHI_001]